MKVWNVACRNASGGVIAEFAIYANTAAQALREAARNVARDNRIASIEFTLTGTTYD